jgi:hypothetical protein
MAPPKNTRDYQDYVKRMRKRVAKQLGEKALERDDEEDEKEKEEEEGEEEEKKEVKGKHKEGKEEEEEEGGEMDITQAGTTERMREAKELVKQVELPQLDYSKINLDSLVLVVGKRRYGKTTWTEHLLYHLHYYFPNGGFVFTKTKHNYFWQQHFPDTRIYDGWQPEVIRMIMDKQKQLVSMIMDGDDSIVPWVCIVLDDIITEKSAMDHDPLWEEICFSGRHFKIFCVMCIQDGKGVGPMVRQNADLIAATFQTQERQLDQLTRDYADYFPNRRVFHELLQRNTTDHQLVVIDQTEAHYDVKDVFYVDKAGKECPPYKVGDDWFWKESGCSWEKQLEKHKNVPAGGKQEEWKKKLEARYKRAEEEKPVEFSMGGMVDYEFLSNQIEFAPESVRDAYRKSKQKKSASEQAAEQMKKIKPKFVGAPLLMTGKGQIGPYEVPDG